jgi:hypothetical protein
VWEVLQSTAARSRQRRARRMPVLMLYTTVNVKWTNISPCNYRIISQKSMQEATGYASSSAGVGLGVRTRG